MEEKYYTSSDGTKTPMKDIETTHLINGLSKRYREIYNATNKDEFSKKLKEIDDIKEEVYKRHNKFYEELKD